MRRNKFIKRVYSILMLQLLFTIGAVLLVMNDYDIRRFLYLNDEYFWLAVVVSIASITALGCCDGVSRKKPYNIILLCVFTVAETFIVSICCLYYTPEMILNAALATLAAVLGLTLYALTSKTDYSNSYSKCYGKYV